MGVCAEYCGSYETVKIVRLKDARLACFRFLTLLGCLAYTLFQLFLSHQYAKFATPIGQVTVEYLAPNTTFSHNHSYCLNSNFPNSTYPDDARFECEIWDDVEFVFGSIPSSTFITTQVNSSQQQRQDCSNGCTVPWVTKNTSQIYTAQVSEYALKLTTTYEAQLGTKTIANMTYYLKGKLVGQSGQTMQTFGQLQSDIITVQDLLTAAGVSLDSVSDWTYNTNFNYTYRTWGMLLVVQVELDNKVVGLLGETTYTYSVTRVPNKKYLIRQVVPSLSDSTNTRTVQDRYGIQVVFTVVGDIGYFDFQTLLLTLVGATALLSVSRLLVEFFMLKVVKQKDKYKNVKYDIVSMGAFLNDPTYALMQD